MVALCIIMAVLLIIVIILLIPVGAEAEYAEPGVTLWLRIGAVQLIMELLPVGIEALGRFKRGLIIKKLRLYFCFGGDDPAKVALTFGGASAGAGVIVPLLQQNFRIKETDIRNSVDFTSTENRVYAHADIRIRPITVIAIALSAGVKVLKIFIRRKKETKAEQPVAEAEKGR